MYETSTAPNPVAAFEYWVSTAITKGNAPVPVCSPKSSPVGQDFYQSRVIRAVHESLHLRIDCHFFVLVSARRGRKKNQCNHKAQRWTEPYPLHQRDNKRTKKRMFKDFQGHISATTRCSARSFRNHKAKCRRPVSRSYFKLKSTVSSPKAIYFLGAVEPKLHPTYLDWSNEHLSWKVWRTDAIHPRTPPNNRERW